MKGQSIVHARTLIREMGAGTACCHFIGAGLNATVQPDMKVAALSISRGNGKTWLPAQLAA